MLNMSRSQNKILGEFFFFSCLMFTLPFASFFGTKSFLEKYSKESNLPLDIFLPVLSSVLTIWAIIGIYVYRAYNDKDNYEVDKKKDS